MQNSIKALQSRWQDLYMFLKNEGFEVYAPGQHKGDTLSCYIVVTNEALEAGKGTDQAIYSLLLYTPESQYSQQEVFVNKVTSAMLKVRPVFERYSSQDTPVYDQGTHGYYTRVFYQNFRKRPLRYEGASNFINICRGVKNG